MPTLAAVQASHAAYAQTPSRRHYYRWHIGNWTSHGRSIRSLYQRKGSHHHYWEESRGRRTHCCVFPQTCRLRRWLETRIRFLLYFSYVQHPVNMCGPDWTTRKNQLPCSGRRVCELFVEEREEECDYRRLLIIYYHIIHLINLLAIRGRKT